MIRIVPTEHLIGAKLQGDYCDLNELYDALSRYLDFYQESTSYPYEDYEYLLALNYDIRHAYMGTRDVVAVSNNYEDYDLLRASEDPDLDLDEKQREELKQYKQRFCRNNLYFSVEIAVPLILYYLTVFQHILDSYYLECWFEKYNDGTHGLPYDPMTADHDRTQIRLFNASVWNYLRSLLGEADANTLFHYFTYNDERSVFPSMYIDAILAYYHANASNLSEADLKKFILYTAYCIMDPVSTRYKNKSMLPCHSQYQQIKNDLKGKITKPLPSYLRFIELENKYFGEKESVTPDEFDDFIEKYFGNPDWEDMTW